jgi:hypothetical protein
MYIVSTKKFKYLFCFNSCRALFLYIFPINEARLQYAAARFCCLQHYNNSDNSKCNIYFYYLVLLLSLELFYYWQWWSERHFAVDCEGVK